jgi:hypothetical protein
MVRSNCAAIAFTDCSLISAVVSMFTFDASVSTALSNQIRDGA